MNELRLGMVGSGQISDRFFRMAQELPAVRFVATVARRLENARQKAEQYAVPAYYDDYEKMMDQERPDAVVVTTPHSVHAEVCLAAFSRKMHVLNEKPMATRWEDCQAMVRAADAAEIVFMQLPYDNSGPMRTAQALMREEILGRITGAEACLNIPGPPRDNWYYDRAIAHGGAMLDCMVYPVSRLVSLLGRAERVTAFVNTLIPNRIVGGGKRVVSDVDDNVALLLEFSEGQIAVVRSVWGTAFSENSTTVFGRTGTVILPGDGRVLVQNRDERPPTPEAQPADWRGWRGVYAVPAQPNPESMLAHFVRCIREGQEPTCSGRRQLHVHEILFQGYRSALRGETLSLTTSYEPWYPLDRTLFDTKSEFL